MVEEVLAGRHRHRIESIIMVARRRIDAGRKAELAEVVNGAVQRPCFLLRYMRARRLDDAAFQPAGSPAQFRLVADRPAEMVMRKCLLRRCPDLVEKVRGQRPD